jgi:peptide deformylase
MATREIITIPHPTLRRKARKVTEFGPELQKLIDDMVETMRQAPGVGLAAPQVDVPLRVIVVEFGSEEDENVPPKLYTIVNPEIPKAACPSPMSWAMSNAPPASRSKVPTAAASR